MPGKPSLARVPGTGAHVLVDAQGTEVVRVSSGRFLRLQAPPSALLDVLAGIPGGDEGSVAYAERLRSVVASREDEEAQRRWPGMRRGVAVVGEGPIVDSTAEALAGWGVAVTRHPDPQALFDMLAEHDQSWSLVIAYADSPAERVGWERLDTLPGRGLAWLRAYREGENCFVDPICVSEDDPGAEQVSRRRRAASQAPRELLSWQGAAGVAGRAGTAEPMSPAESTLLLGRLLTVALAWAQDSGTLGAYRATLWKLVPATGTISEHTVLSYEEPPAIDRGADRRA